MSSTRRCTDSRWFFWRPAMTRFATTFLALGIAFGTSAMMFAATIA
jgi:hypothetical protein